MSIVDSGSVLILGAGVSAPFGLPLGAHLIDEIARQIEDDDRRLFPTNMPDPQWLFNAATSGQAFFNTPVYGAAFADLVIAGQAPDIPAIMQRREGMILLHARLKGQTAETIDDFIVENPAVAELAKVAVGALMVRASYVRPIDGAPPTAKLLPFGNRYYPNAIEGSRPGRNWTHLLVNIIRHAVRTGALDGNRRIPIITFNYDKILEHVLDEQFDNTELTCTDWRQYIEIIHVHGEFPALVNNTHQFGALAREWARGIHVVNAVNVPQEIADARSRAREQIARSKNIYVAGFSFARPNCELLGLHELASRHPTSNTIHLHFCNYDGNAGVALAAGRWANASPPKLRVDEHTLGPDRLLSVENWIKAGYLGDLPG